MAASSETLGLIRFGRFDLSLETRELRKDGVRLKLSGQAVEVLLLLVASPGKLVAREEFQQKLWPGASYGDPEHGLNAAVNRLRETLGDSATEPRYIETVPGRGYRFISPLEGGSAAINGSSGTVTVAPGTKHKVWLPMCVAVMLVLMTAVGYGVYSFLSRKGAVPFENFTIAQITNTGKVAAAAISPDGKFLLSVLDERGKQSLSLRNIATNSDAEVIAPADALYQNLAFSPDSNYIYFRKAVDKTLQSNLLLRASVLGGTSQVVVRDIDTAFTFSPEGKRLAYVRENNPEVGKFQVLTAKADGTDEKMLAGGPISAMPNAIAWSPDGKQIATAIPGLGDALSVIQVEDVASARTQTLGRFNKEFIDLAWLPDGRGLLATYQSNLNFYGHAQVGFISNPGGQFRTVTKDTNSYETLTLSADGKTLVTVQDKLSQTLYLMPAAGFEGQPPSPAPAQNKDSSCSSSFGWASNGDLYFDGGLRISADGRNTTRLLSNPTGQINTPVSCADGRYVLVEWAGRDGGNKINIWRLDSDGSNPKQLTDGVLDGHPRCAPDGAWVYYYEFRVGQIKRVQIDGGTPEIVPGTVIPGTVNMQAAISPDGKLLAFVAAQVTPPGPTQIALVNLDAGAKPPRRMIVPDPRISGAPVFTPDGNAVVYPVGENSVNNLWLQPLEGSRGRRITNFQSDQIQTFEFSPDGKTLGVLLDHDESDVVLLRDTGSMPR